MKPLKKHPKQQRMEDMTFPITKTGKKMNKIIAKGLNKKDVDTPELGSELTLDKLEAQFKKAFFSGLVDKDENDKTIWEGREWLRSINDDNGFSLMNRLAWRVIAIAVFTLAVIYFLFKV